ncbi:MAG: TonB-dependent receptor, partial [Bacteroidetes bacterium]|nr:TonB-dependent receptor [Bacteroidota bacterium]
MVIICFEISHLYASESIMPKPASITGVVVDHLTGNPIEYANLVLYTASDSVLITGTVSSAEGQFALEKLVNGVYFIKIHFMGYQTLEVKNIELDKGKAVDLGVLTMEPLSINLKEAEVVASNDYVCFKVDKQVIQVSAQAGAEGGVVADALANVPSVQVDGAGNITLRGSTSFTVLVDGRPTVLDATETLNQTPANAVEKIEIITNPGVKYDADGTTGIINLIMKKQKSNGSSAQATLTLATGDKYTANVMVNHRGKALTSYLNATYSNKRKQTESTDSREAYTGDTTQNQFIASARDLYWRNYQVSGGFSLNPNAKNTWSLDAEIGQWEFDRRINSNMQIFNSYSPDTNMVGMMDRFLITNTYVSGNAGYSRLFSKEDNKLDINLYYVHLRNDTPNHITENYPGTEMNSDSLHELQLNSHSHRNQVRLNVDYTLPLSEKIMFETGWQSEGKFSGTDYEYQFDFPDAGQWVSDSSMTDRMDFRHMVNGLYGMLG